MESVLMRIGEVAAFFNVSVKAMRIYEKMGILKPVKVDEKTGYRYYSADQIKQLDALLELRELGFSLAEIRDLLENGITQEQYMEVLVHKKVMWQEKMSQAQDRIDTIDEVIEKLVNSKPPVKLHELTEAERAHLLSRLACLDVNLHELHGRNILSEALWL
ncbi:MerR family transcriptional regulator [Kineothrix sp. MB12-C1]|uniref:MerR family transcriptional regulator n=1 Tax=Kineothrix sp. MB12-C1 TaxID=3070215 RepID=UPI0027D2CAF6|nr:helix-turn-helix domain-containing protein [Kineothrix sp. MB12-C1]WMC93645.1 helix-turn-helix domain-containing protein [Kineothrix sp. MB12-C1]